MKSRVAERLGISVTILEKNENISTDEAVAIIQEISDINHAEKYDGVVIQLPLPASLDTEKILNSLPEKLDIDMLGEKAREKYAETGGQMENEVKSLTDAISAENGHGRQATV
jgi:5,10-methylene-tetrahydrofolate dehydrogenase/methenyl tetrahydrofolate cyclohydrolase